MTTAIQSLTEIADGYDAIVLDQWGVLHNGSTPYPGVADALKSITAAGHRLAILSNSGKRADPNADRIRQMGFASGLFTTVMTAGEALWHDVKTGSVPHRSFHVIESRQGDATRWAEGLDIGMGCDIRTADAVLLMGLPDDTTLMPWQPVLDAAGDRNLTVYCSNPDHIAPRAGGRTVLSPGALAREYEQLGGDVVY
ncbi:MAG: TIGR01459 family HAD-type hydrolase, partial [Rhodobacteraceae bacterium]|nr:TIGR01459 family HAD-type hydrolase [Paracoccaceae bacterium]